MATLGDRRNADRVLPLGPVASDTTATSLTASVRFPIGVAGDPFVATATSAYHLVCGDGTVEADTSAPPFTGAIRMLLPDGCTHVAMIRATADTTLGAAYPG